jgi:hypothetical protein
MKPLGKTKRYYMSSGSQLSGPYELWELESKNIAQNTLVWHNGLDNYMPAGELPELKELLKKPFATNDKYNLGEKLQMTKNFLLLFLRRVKLIS